MSENATEIRIIHEDHCGYMLSFHREGEETTYDPAQPRAGWKERRLARQRAEWWADNLDEPTEITDATQ